MWQVTKPPRVSRCRVDLHQYLKIVLIHLQRTTIISQCIVCVSLFEGKRKLDLEGTICGKDQYPSLRQGDRIAALWRLTQRPGLLLRMAWALDKPIRLCKVENVPFTMCVDLRNIRDNVLGKLNPMIIDAMGSCGEIEMCALSGQSQPLTFSEGESCPRIRFRRVL